MGHNVGPMGVLAHSAHLIVSIRGPCFMVYQMGHNVSPMGVLAFGAHLIVSINAQLRVAIYYFPL